MYPIKIDSSCSFVTGIPSLITPMVALFRVRRRNATLFLNGISLWLAMPNNFYSEGSGFVRRTPAMYDLKGSGYRYLTSEEVDDGASPLKDLNFCRHCWDRAATAAHAEIRGAARHSSRRIPTSRIDSIGPLGDHRRLQQGLHRAAFFDALASDTAFLQVFVLFLCRDNHYIPCGLPFSGPGKRCY